MRRDYKQAIVYNYLPTTEYGERRGLSGLPSGVRGKTSAENDFRAF